MSIDLLTTGRAEIRRRARGYCVEGPGFYVWDEDPREVSSAARDLTRGTRWSPPAELPPSAKPEPRG